MLPYDPPPPGQEAEIPRGKVSAYGPSVAAVCLVFACVVTTPVMTPLFQQGGQRGRDCMLLPGRGDVLVVL